MSERAYRILDKNGKPFELWHRDAQDKDETLLLAIGKEEVLLKPLEVRILMRFLAHFVDHGGLP